MVATLFRTLVETLVFDLSFGSYDETFYPQGEYISRSWDPLCAKVHYSYVLSADVFTLGVDTKDCIWQYQVVFGEDADAFTNGFTSLHSPLWLRRLRMKLTSVPF